MRLRIPLVPTRFCVCISVRFPSIEDEVSFFPVSKFPLLLCFKRCFFTPSWLPRKSRIDQQVQRSSRCLAHGSTKTLGKKTFEIPQLSNVIEESVLVWVDSVRSAVRVYDLNSTTRWVSFLSIHPLITHVPLFSCYQAFPRTLFCWRCHLCPQGRPTCTCSSTSGQLNCRSRQSSRFLHSPKKRSDYSSSPIFMIWEQKNTET